MALQSQTLRGSSSIRSSSGVLVRTNRTAHRRLLGLILLVLVLGAGFIYVARSRDGGGLGPAAARADETTLSGVKGSTSGAVPPMNTPLAAATPTQPEPTVLEMGSRTRAGSAAPSNALPAFTAATRPSVPAATPPPTGTMAGMGQARDPLGSGQQAPRGAPPSSAPSPAPATPATTGSSPDGSGLPGELAAVQTLAERAITEKRLVDARTQLNKILVDPRISEKDREGIRRWMTDLNKDLVFSANAYPNDPMVEMYKVEKGDSPIKISRKVNSVTEYGLIVRVNGINPNALSVGRQLKIVKGPFHAVVSKSAFRMDVYQGPPPAPGSVGTSGLGAGAEPGWTYIRSFPVGLGEKGGTPLGAFVVKEGSKLVNPPWVNPRTGEKFDKDNPKNPIGERWIGLSGLDEKTKAFNGYGIHATIVPESIGKEMSMGCVRMNEEDVEVVYEMLMGKVSVVKIVP
jgi:hypothetical protein